MEWVTRGIRSRNRSIKPIKIPVRSPTSPFRNQDDNEEEPLSPSSLLFHEPNFNIYNIAIMGGKTPINASVAFEKLPHTLLKHPRFSSLQVVDDEDGGKTKWVPTNVDLHNHIIIPTIPESLASPDKFLEDYVYNLSKTSIDSSKPMWELHLLNLKTSDAESIGIFRIHHSLGDGTSLMSLLLACTRQISNPEAVPTIPTKKGSNIGWFSSHYCSGVVGTIWWRFFMAICMVCMLIWNTIVDVLYVMVTALFLKDTETPLKAFDGVEFTPRRFVYRMVSLDDMKLIKNALNMVIY